MVRALVVYYSLSGTTKQVADILISELQKKGIDTVVEVIKCAQAEGVGMAKQGFRTVTGTKYNLDNPPENDPRQFEFVFIGAPVWSFGNIPVPEQWMKSVQFDIDKTKFGAFVPYLLESYSKLFGLYNRVFNKIEKAIGKPLTAKVAILQKEVKEHPETVLQKIEDLINGVIPGDNTTSVPSTENVTEVEQIDVETKEENKTE
ncbi:MAG: hypothetical protein EZS28_037363 [Streblomastix strix]|uniref:Flavodoxin-like domain-containing protein n=1 Tax=Streblomastix strix TaxID=222440 RepID=A0A5J4U9J0_9EUKA|nr:MAG: hypothetical protein EZS28_037363 [Streblomastix strix]